MNLIKAEVFERNRGMDGILIHTDLPAPITGEPKVSIKMAAIKGDAVPYLQKHFPGLPITVIDASGITNKRKKVKK